MKYCVSSYQTKQILQQADEIRIRYPHRQHIMDLIETYPDKTFIFELPEDLSEIDWDLLKAYADKVDFHLCVKTLDNIIECKNRGITKYFWGYPVSTFAELKWLAEARVSFVNLGAPLYFQLDKVVKFLIPIRLCPNVASYSPTSIMTGLCGPWFRPEDTKYYEPYVSSIDFITDTVPKEAVLFKVYAIDKTWGDDLDILLTNLGQRLISPALPEEFGERRTVCGQSCMERTACRHCAIMAKTAELVENEYKERRRQKLLN